MSPDPRAGARRPLEGISVLELAGDTCAYAAKLLADLGAEVVVVEPPGGHPSRRYGPFVSDEEDPERCLWWWFYNTSKRSVVLDLETTEGRGHFRRLAGEADLVVEGEPPGRLARLGIDHDVIRAEHEGLVWLSITPFGRQGPRADEPATDLTLLAASGVVWNCGYDDHTIPPVRGGGNQAAHIAGVIGANAALVALLWRTRSGAGQHIDLSMYAAANVTTESGSYVWLVSEKMVQRQTGRHAGSFPTLPVQVLAADGRYVTSGFPPHSEKDLRSTIAWLEELGLDGEFPDLAVLELGVERGGVDFRDLATDPVAVEIFGAGREAICLIASRLTSYDFFMGAQARDMQCGVVYTPDEALEDPHTVARGYQVEVEHPELGRSVVYPGAPFKMSGSPWAISRRPPLVGEHDELLKEVASTGDVRPADR